VVISGQLGNQTELGQVLGSQRHRHILSTSADNNLNPSFMPTPGGSGPNVENHHVRGETTGYPMWFNCLMSVEDDAEVDGDLKAVNDFLRQLKALPNKQRHALMTDLPLAQMRTAAIHHPDPWVRRSTMFFLDHYANDASTSTFLAALDDPFTPVREMALHGLACEQCRAAELCVDDVIPVLCRVVASDMSPDVRHKAIPILLGLAHRDARARAALESAASSDPDQFVQQAAVAALEGRYRDALRSRHDLLRRSKTRRGKANAAAASGRRQGLTTEPWRGSCQP